MSLSGKVLPYTMTGAKRVEHLQSQLQRLINKGIPGDFVETGVWKGGNLLLAGLIFKEKGEDRHVWGYDTFTGMDRPTEADRRISTGKSPLGKYEEGRTDFGCDWCYAPYTEVDTLLKEQLGEGAYTLVKGRVEDTLYEPANLPERIVALRLDTDWYTSHKAALGVLYPRLSEGGVLIIDDYGRWEGAQKAVDEYFAGAETTLERVDVNCRMVVKRADV